MTTLRELVAQVATAYFSNVSVSAGDIPVVMASIANSLAAVQEPEAPAAAGAAGAAPAEEPRGADRSEVQRSITPDALISFEDGRPYKTLRRHLAARGLTPAQYRAKHNLPDDYPMVAPNTSAARSQLARRIGLGGRTTRREPQAPAENGPNTGPQGRRTRTPPAPKPARRR